MVGGEALQRAAGTDAAGINPFPSGQEAGTGEVSAVWAGAGCCCRLHAAGEGDTGREMGDKCLGEDRSDKGKVWTC